MSQDRVEIVHRLMDAWNRADLNSGMELIEPEIEVEVAMGSPLDGTYSGLEEALRFLAEFWSQFDTYRSEMTECIPVGDQVVVGVRHSGTGRGSGVEVDMPSWQLWGFQGSRVVSWRNFATRPQAFAAAEVVDERPPGA